jgi:hypothetical protein
MFRAVSRLRLGLSGQSGHGAFRSLIALILLAVAGSALLPSEISAQAGKAIIPASVPAPTAVGAPAAASAPATVPKTDTSKTAQAPLDSASAKNGPAVAKSRQDSVLIVKHSFNHRQQIITGSVIMSCLALIMVTMNNYNPR